MQEITEEDFEAEVLRSSTPVLVEFGAEWCTPCNRLKPVLEELSQEYEGKMRFVEVNVDDSPELSRSYGIKSVPSVHIFSGGEAIEVLRGEHKRSAYAQAVDRALG